MPAPNRNLLWTDIAVEELIRGGLRHVCIAPGSRSTPLALSFYARRDQITLYSHLDERSAAYFALGIGLATGIPAAVLCTSGTAAANFYPAIIEAFQARVPLLVLTADRAHELRESGANQTIDQVKLYGDNVLWSVDVALPENAPPPVLLRGLRTLMARALRTANGFRKGPVHLNFPFRKPLEPIPVSTDVTTIPTAAEPRPSGEPFSQILHGLNDLPTAQIVAIAAVFDDHERGVIVCGPNTPEGADEAIAELSRKTGYPVIVDGLSSLRFSPYQRDIALISGCDSFLGKTPLDPPDVVVRFGDVPTSAALLNWMMALTARYVIHFNTGWSDDSHRVSHLILADPARLCAAVCQYLLPRSVTGWTQRWQFVEQVTRDALNEALQGEFFDGQIAADMVELLPNGSALFVGNSLPVRHVDQFSKPRPGRLHLYANRGASGIDGVVSTALGVAVARPNHPLTLLIGDISLYHDMNGLLAISRCRIPITIVVLNNNGGGIFRRLPIREFEPAFTDLFLTPHGLHFEHVAHLYGLEYHQVTSRRGFQEVFSAPSGRARLIEVCTDGHRDWARREAIMEAVTLQLQSKIIP